MQQRPNVIPSYAPILPFAPFCLFIVNSYAQALKPKGKTERIFLQILVDFCFN